MSDKDQERRERHERMLQYLFDEIDRKHAAWEAEEQRQAEQQQEADRAYLEALEEKRLERLTREAYESLSPTERAEFESQYGSLPTLKRAIAQARKEADARWMQAEQERQKTAMIEWRKSKGKIKIRDQQGREWEEAAPISPQEEARQIAELHQDGAQRAEARLQARKRRELESELRSNDIERLWLMLDADERKIAHRVLSEQPSELEKIQNFITERRNPIEHIDDARTLYRIANQKPPAEAEWVEPVSNIENVNDPKMLYKMARKEIEEKQQQKEMRK